MIKKAFIFLLANATDAYDYDPAAPFDSWVGLSNQDDTTIDYNDDGDPMSREERLVREVEWLFQRTHLIVPLYIFHGFFLHANIFHNLYLFLYFSQRKIFRRKTPKT